MADAQTISNEKYAEKVLSGIQKFLQVQKYTDVTLKSGEVEIQCHRLVLAAVSEYFDAMFSAGFKETSSTIVKLDGIDSVTLTTLVDYLYTSNIKITIDNVQNLAQACDQLRITCLQTLCEEFMAQHVTPENAVGFHMFADRYNLKSLKEAAWSSMLKNFCEVSRSNEFCKMTIGTLIQYITDTGLNAAEENKVFEAVCSWVDFDRENREILLHQLLEHIRLPLCTLSYLAETVVTYPPMRRVDCHQYFVDALKYHVMNHEQRLQNTNPRTLPRHASECLVVVGGFRSGGWCYDIKYLNSSLNVCDESSSWQLLTELPTQVQACRAIIVQGGILITGGCKTSGKSIRECWWFDLQHRKWSSIPPMLVSRYYHGSVLNNGHVYVAGGGYNSSNRQKTVEMYDLTQQKWSSLPDIPKVMENVCMVSCDQYLCVISGENRSMFVFDTVRQMWETRKDLPVQQDSHYCTAVSLNDTLYVVGGTHYCMRYEMMSDVWTILTPPKGSHNWSTATLSQGKILLIGGKSTDVIEEYDPVADSWCYSDVKLDHTLNSHSSVMLDRLIN